MSSALPTWTTDAAHELSRRADSSFPGCSSDTADGGTLASARLDRPASVSEYFPSALTPASPNGDRDGLAAACACLHPWESMRRWI